MAKSVCLLPATNIIMFWLPTVEKLSLPRGVLYLYPNLMLVMSDARKGRVS